MKKQVKKKIEGKFWILWCPTSDKPPRKRFHKKKKAEEVANLMVDKYGAEFFVMQSQTLHKKGQPEIVPFSGPPVSPLKVPEQINNREQAWLNEMRGKFNSSEAEARTHAWLNGKSVDTEVWLEDMRGHAWTKEQDRELTQLFHRHQKLVVHPIPPAALLEIANMMRRSILSIQYRLDKLGLRKM